MRRAAVGAAVALTALLAGAPVQARAASASYVVVLKDGGTLGGHDDDGAGEGVALQLALPVRERAEGVRGRPHATPSSRGCGPIPRSPSCSATTSSRPPACRPLAAGETVAPGVRRVGAATATTVTRREHDRRRGARLGRRPRQPGSQRRERHELHQGWRGRQGRQRARHQRRRHRRRPQRRQGRRRRRPGDEDLRGEGAGQDRDRHALPVPVRHQLGDGERGRARHRRGEHEHHRQAGPTTATAATRSGTRSTRPSVAPWPPGVTYVVSAGNGKADFGTLHPRRLSRGAHRHGDERHGRRAGRGRRGAAVRQGRGRRSLRRLLELRRRGRRRRRTRSRRREPAWCRTSSAAAPRRTTGRARRRRTSPGRSRSARAATARPARVPG